MCRCLGRGGMYEVWASHGNDYDVQNRFRPEVCAGIPFGCYAGARRILGVLLGVRVWVGARAGSAIHYLYCPSTGNDAYQWRQPCGNDRLFIQCYPVQRGLGKTF